MAEQGESIGTGSDDVSAGGASTGETPIREECIVEARTGEVRSVETNNDAVRKWLDVSLIATVLTAFVYLTGRLYTEQFYGEFAVNYRSLQFDTATYMFNGWNVLSTGILLIAALGILVILVSQQEWLSTLRADLANNILSEQNRRNIELYAPLLLIIIILSIAMVVIIAFLFSLEIPLDLMVQGLCGLGLLAFFINIIMRDSENGRESDNESTGHISLSKLKNYKFFILLLILWPYFVCVTFAMAKYHVARAKVGGMGVKIARLAEHENNAIDECWWLVVTKTDDLTLLYNPNNQNLTKTQTLTSTVGVSLLVPNNKLGMTLDHPKEMGSSLYRCDHPINQNTNEKQP